MIKTIEERFWKKVEKKGEDDCWEWMGGISRGYGKMYVDGKLLQSNRLSFYIHNGKIPDELKVCHHCDNRKCVNPKHLFLGTHKDNMEDRDNKERNIKGEKCSWSKLTQKQVDEIRKNKSYKELSEIYKISIHTVKDILYYKSWKN